MPRPVGSKNKPKDDPTIEAVEPFELTDGVYSLPIDETLTTEKILETFPSMPAPVEFDSDGLTPGYSPVAAVKAPAFLDGDSTEGQAAALEAKDEQAAAAPIPYFVGLTSFNDLIATLQANDQWVIAENLIKQKAESDRWQAHEEAIEAAQVEMTAEVVEPGSEDDPFTASEPYYHIYSPEDIKSLVFAALNGKADAWETEAEIESLKGAANQGAMSSLRWGANQLREIAGLINHLPDGEWVEPEIVKEEEPMTT